MKKILATLMTLALFTRVQAQTVSSINLGFSQFQDAFGNVYSDADNTTIPVNNTIYDLAFNSAGGSVQVGFSATLLGVNNLGNGLYSDIVAITNWPALNLFGYPATVNLAAEAADGTPLPIDSVQIQSPYGDAGDPYGWVLNTTLPDTQLSFATYQGPTEGGAPPVSDFRIDVEVPEPGELVFFILGLFLAGSAVRKRQQMGEKDKPVLAGRWTP